MGGLLRNDESLWRRHARDTGIDQGCRESQSGIRRFHSSYSGVYARSLAGSDSWASEDMPEKDDDVNGIHISSYTHTHTHMWCRIQIRSFGIRG